YGLLGPSGCGKTTLLSCIVGRMRLDYGSIKLSATTRRELGYMPQDLNLHLRLSIWETLKFYGYLFGMEIDEIRKRADELIKFLQLPPEGRMVQDLSGGQQRRTSLAVALLHNPDLLILDEPTVGLDPVLSKSIWDRLVEMTENGKTVMITTHYIEEARQAHIIGLMREGVLLAEESPASLMARRNVDSLETAFLQLSQLQEHNSKKAIEPKAYPVGPRPPVTLADNTWFLPSRFKAQVMKNLYLLKREHIFVAFVFLLPIVQMTLFNTAIGQDPKNLPFGVVSYDTPNGFADCRPDAYHGCLLDSSYNYSITCKYREHLLKKDFAVKEFRSLEEARSNVWHNNIWGVIFFNQNFTKALGERIDKRNRLDDETLEMSIMDAWIDLSSEHNMAVQKTFIKKEVLCDCIVNDGWKEITFNSSGTPSIQDIKIPQRTGGLNISNHSNRFIFWKTRGNILELVEHSLDVNVAGNQLRYKFEDSPVLGDSYLRGREDSISAIIPTGNILELVEHSLDVNVAGNQLRYKFEDSPVLGDSISMYETKQNIVLLVATISSVHKIKFPRPKVISTRHEYVNSIFADPGAAESINNPASYHIINTASTLPYTGASYLTPEREAIFALALQSGSVAIVKINPNTEKAARVFDIKNDSFFGGLNFFSTKSRGLSQDGSILGMVVKYVKKSLYFVTLSFDGQLKCWNSEMSLVGTCDALNYCKTRNLGIQSHLIRKPAADLDPSLWIYFCLEGGNSCFMQFEVSQRGTIDFRRKATDLPHLISTQMDQLIDFLVLNNLNILSLIVMYGFFDNPMIGNYATVFIVLNLLGFGGMFFGVTFSEMTGSMLVVQFVVMLIQNILSLIVMYGFFDNPMIGNYATVFIVLNLLGFGGMFFGILIGVGCNTYYMAAYVGTASNLMLVFICVRCAFYLPTILTASLMITEKMGGLIERIMVAGVTFSEMTGSMLVVQFVVMLIQNILSLIVMYGFFDNPMIGNYATVFIVLNLLGFGGMFFGILIGVGCNTYYMAAYVGTASNLMLVFICGLAWPVEGAHYLLKSVSWMFPLTLTTQGLRGMTARGWPLMHPTVLEGVASIVVWIGLFVLICIVLIKTEKGSWVSAK
ncbi:uncharacterized protein LOC103520270, partial [Diaphorina citri]|uniref:Uncharacterized protein LOC103520270 n=1 Tax=Diaphorina citri TaxID=121845 RepID=A0A1S4EP52_DIACI